MRQSGFSITEFMVTMLVTSILLMAVGQTLSSSTNIIAQQSKLIDAQDESSAVLKAIEELLRQAELCSTCNPAKVITISYPTSAGLTNPNTVLAQNNDGVTVDIQLPAGFSIWPNNVSPFNSPFVRLDWSASTGDVTVESASTSAALGTGTARKLIVSNSKSPKIVNIDIWPLTSAGAVAGVPSALPDGGYRVCVTARTSTQDPGYLNPNDQTGLMKNYRTSTLCSIVFPRNW